MTIEHALLDLGVSVNILSGSLYDTFEIGDSEAHDYCFAVG